MKLKKRGNAIRVPPVKKAIRVKRKSDTEEESTVSKAIQNVKKVFEKKNTEASKLLSARKVIKKRKVFVPKKVSSVPQRKSTRGMVYLGHIPHGFYEEQMTDYFEQFGKVTRVRVVRSRNTGKSCGYGYIEFLHPEVAKVAAETMNNYLMCGRLLKATYIPPEAQHIRYFAGNPWTEQTCPKIRNRSSVTELRNEDISNTKHRRFVQSIQDRLSTLEKKLKEKGFDIKFVPTDGTKP